MTRNESSRGIHRGILGSVLLVVCFLGGCLRGPVVYTPKEQIALDRRNVEYPAGFELNLLMAGLNAPSAIAFDSDGTLLVAEAGIDGDEPRIFAVRPDLSVATIYPTAQRIPFSPFQPGFRIYGPIGGMVVDQDHHKIYVSHRDKNAAGVITQFGFDGSHTTIVAELPAQGDYGVTDLAIYHDRLFFGVGSATNSGVVGLDNLRWLRRHQSFCDQVFQDLELGGLRFTTKNPFAGLFGGSDIVDTGPFLPFGTFKAASVSRTPTGKPNGAVCSVALTGGDFQVEAWGIRYPRGLAFDEFNALYVSNNGMELRGSRPAKDDPDVIVRVLYGHPPTWYGFPDYSTDMQPITDKAFQPPRPMLMGSGFPKLTFLIDHGASELPPPNPLSLLKAKEKPLSGLAKMNFAPKRGPLSHFYGDLFAAESGDRFPYATGGYEHELKAPVGYKVVRINIGSGKVEDFIRNTQVLPASKLRGSILGLERPIDVKIGPVDGALYVLDFGQVEYNPTGREKITRGTGKIFRLVPATSATTRP